MGHSDLAVEHDEEYEHGPDDGNGSRVVPGDLGRDDDRDDGSRDHHDEPGFRASPTHTAHRLAGQRVCLATCCTPLDFIHGGWRDGSTGTFRLGLEHGISCLGSNWLLCVLLFPLGIMNIGAMAGLTVVIFAEKMFPRGERIAQGVGLALILYGALVIVVPAALLLNGTGM